MDITDKIVMKHLLENHSDVLVVAIDHIKNMGEMAKLDDAIREGDIEKLLEIRDKNLPLYEAILETDY